MINSIHIETGNAFCFIYTIISMSVWLVRVTGLKWWHEKFESALSGPVHLLIWILKHTTSFLNSTQLRWGEVFSLFISPWILETDEVFFYIQHSKLLQYYHYRAANNNVIPFVTIFERASTDYATLHEIFHYSLLPSSCGSLRTM